MSIDSTKRISDKKIRDLKFVIANQQAGKIINALLSKELYSNQIFAIVGGSKSSLTDNLHHLEKSKIISGVWDTEEIVINNRKTVRAVKKYHVNQNFNKIINNNLVRRLVTT